MFRELSLRDRIFALLVGAIVLGGLLLSTVFTLFVVPTAFTLLWRLRGHADTD